MFKMEGKLQHNKVSCNASILIFDVYKSLQAKHKSSKLRPRTARMGHSILALLSVTFLLTLSCNGKYTLILYTHTVQCSTIIIVKASLLYLVHYVYSYYPYQCTQCCTCSCILQCKLTSFVLYFCTNACACSSLGIFHNTQLCLYQCTGSLLQHHSV